MTARRIAYLALAISGAASGYYFFLYLTKWEWNRAVIAGLIFMATEIALVGALVLDRLGRLRVDVEKALTKQSDPDPDVLARVHDSAPPPRDHFAWLSPRSGRTGVFVPILLGAGVIVSGLAWIVEHVARATASPAMERNLARQLSVFALPDEPLYSRQASMPNSLQPHGARR